MSEPNEPRLPAQCSHDGGLTLVNTFYAKPGKLDAFLSLQVEEAERLGDVARASGWRGNRIHRSCKGDAAIVVTVFDSREARDAWIASEEFAAHLERIDPLIDRVESRECELVATYGDL